ncbi:MAG: hypothetical protein U5L45_22120 [Saprospiraceae bacterium]|nr:hypothetical protein [Saprospiraceae bacterium]
MVHFSGKARKMNYISSLASEASASRNLIFLVHFELFSQTFLL